MNSGMPVRLRFAPSPTGLMHLGNVRTALMNYLFAKQKSGIFILRIEDTDEARNYDPGARKIMEDLAWLGLTYDEGPFFQSQRTVEYEKRRATLEEKKLIYRCFCTFEELERKRQRQIAMKIPPRYDRTCWRLDQEQIQRLLASNVPFIWRVLLDHAQVVTIHDMARGDISFDLGNFSDFSIARQDGTFTFMFANFVDDMAMNISHVVRGEDHLTNTAGQAFLYHVFNAPMPIFWHLPMLCNTEGKKLSKRDFGFSLGDIKQAGFLPQALLNYLAISGGGMFKQEIMSLDELVHNFKFDAISSTGQVQYDVEKLKWVNHKWIERAPVQDLVQQMRPFLSAVYPRESALVSEEALIKVVDLMRSDMQVLQDAPTVLEFYFKEPVITVQNLKSFIPIEHLQSIKLSVEHALPSLEYPDQFVQLFKTDLERKSIPIKYGFFYIRMALTGKPNGPAIAHLITILGAPESEQRIKRVDWAVDTRR